MHNPRDIVPESIMPAYPWLAATPLSADRIAARHARRNARPGVPYTDEMIAARPRRLPRPGRSRTPATSTRCSPATPRRRRATSTASPGVSELDALIAYLQMLGTLVDFSTFEPDASR